MVPCQGRIVGPDSAHLQSFVDTVISFTVRIGSPTSSSNAISVSERRAGGGKGEERKRRRRKEGEEEGGRKRRRRRKKRRRRESPKHSLAFDQLKIDQTSFS